MIAKRIWDARLERKKRMRKPSAATVPENEAHPTPPCSDGAVNPSEDSDRRPTALSQMERDVIGAIASVTSDVSQSFRQSSTAEEPAGIQEVCNRFLERFEEAMADFKEEIGLLAPDLSQAFGSRCLRPRSCDKPLLEGEREILAGPEDSSSPTSSSTTSSTSTPTLTPLQPTKQAGRRQTIILDLQGDGDSSDGGSADAEAP